MSAHEAAPVPSTIRRAVTILAVSAVVALLYFARQVLVPVCFALLLSFAVLPAVRALQRIGLGRGVAVPVAILALVMMLGGLIAVLGAQVVHLARSLPEYEATIHSRMHVLHHLTLGSLEALENQVGNLLRTEDDLPGTASAASGAPVVGQGASGAATQAPQSALSILMRVLSSAWPPLQATVIVLGVLAFVLLEHESLRDRFIRLAGGADLRATTAAIDDAGERLSRYFIATLSINAGVGFALWLGLTLAGLPNAPLWAVATALLRFVPYVGVWLMAAVVAVFAVAVAPGWSLVLGVMGIYLAVELIASQAIEPMLYGRMTGLSPLAVLVAAIFWSWLWGPVGLVMSTPLTLCLLVAGRHVQALAPLHILLGDTPALTLPQHFYQRALSGDPDELIDDARTYLKTRSFASYCDAVLIPALQLARTDLDAGQIKPAQQVSVRAVVEAVIESADRSSYYRRASRRHEPVAEAGTIGQRLRRRREHAEPGQADDGSDMHAHRVLCVGLGTNIDDVVTEILTRVLRELDIQAMHLSASEFEARGQASGSVMPAISMVYIVNAIPARDTADVARIAAAGRIVAPGAEIVLVCVPEPFAIRVELDAAELGADAMVESLESAAQVAIARFPQ